MRGLLVKDFYMIMKNQWMFFLITFIFLALSVKNSNPFFLLYPAVICGTIPSNLISYDERINWHIFSDTFPYSRKQMVSEKYLIGVITSVVLILLTIIVQGVSGLILGELDFTFIIGQLAFLAMVILLPQAITLPAMFKLGYEKGRIAIYVVLGIMCAGFIILGISNVPFSTDIINTGSVLISVLLSVIVFALSWLLSIKFYEKRDF